MKSKSRRASRRNNLFRRKALAIAIGSAALGITAAAWGQAVNGTIYGTVPVAPGETIQIVGGAGFNRTITVGPSGKYSITLPVGTYTVSLLQDGKVVQSRSGVSPVAAGAVAVDFAGSANAVQTLGAVNVTANRIPAIDVTTTNQVTTITSKQLQQLPLQRTAEDIAMLAPGVGMGSPELVGGPLGTPINVFGGASTAENAYYVDGMNTTEMLNNQGGITLPYGAIEQQQTFISGYDARYGRSIGGVINQIGKSGSNEWHFGARASWQPASWRSDPVNYYFNNPLVTDEPGYMPGDIAVYRKDNSSSETIYDAYASGPIIKDKLFFFVGAEQDNSSYKTTGEFGGTPLRENFTVHDPKLYAKLDWNINDSNILTVTGLQNEHKVWGDLYDFDYDTLKPGNFEGQDQINKTAFRMWVANYTSYITDNLTLNAMLGKVHGEYYTQLPVESPLPYIANTSFQDPRLVPPGGYGNAQPSSTVAFPGHSESVMNYRVSLDYKWDTHDFQVGIDNINSWDLLDGSVNTGPGYQWIYGKSDPGAPIMNSDPNAPPYVGPSTQCYNGTCYYVQQHVDISTASMRVAQHAAYVMDNWQVTPNLLLNLGLRDDSFVNYDASGEPYIRATKPQWAPRLGFSWDVHGDSTLKVFGNAGRYFLALPTQVALSIAAPVTNAGVYYTYTGIDPETGEPTGLTAIPQNPAPPHGVSIDSEYGQAKDPRISASQNIKNEFSDNYVLGMQQQFNMLGTNWVFGATATYQKMSRIIDDFDDEQIECAAGRAQGYAWMTTQNCPDFAQSLVLINPGVTQNILMKAPDGSLVPVTLTAADQQFPRGPTRKYYSLDLSLSHEWDGKWFAKFDYVWAQTIGNTEGPVSTYSQQSGSYESITTAWDFPLRMDNSYGFLPNDRRNTFKIYGAYAINKDWTIGGNLYIASGTPRLCRGHYGPDQQAGSGTYYWCGGVPVPPGSIGRLPWTHQLSLNVDYKPKWADHKLDFNFAIFNVFNEQTPVFYNDFFGTTSSPNEDYGRVQDTRSPRYARFSVSYDF
ncbi:MAG: Oar protein [Rhodanobacteraceae bacterium]|jgi:hypothetical protein|nr:MAG: Oar protein [Rhodanobacteraceae bacterium]